VNVRKTALSNLLRYTKVMVHPYLIFAIGDIHGQFELMQKLHALLLDKYRTDFPNHELTVVHVGDFIDRGPQSFEIIEALIHQEQTADFNVINLRGNHEQQFVDVYNLESEYAHFQDTWLSWGGAETVRSYKAAGKDVPYRPHVTWIEGLPVIWKHEPSKTIFVHAGIDPATYPEVDPDVLLWTRAEEFMNVQAWNNPALDGWTVVHGHTPTKSQKYEIVETEKHRRINIDTGAVYAGSLTAVLIAEGIELEFISVYSNDPAWRRHC